jgi:hypothetical protein
MLCKIPVKEEEEDHRRKGTKESAIRNIMKEKDIVLRSKNRQRFKDTIVGKSNFRQRLESQTFDSKTLNCMIFKLYFLSITLLHSITNSSNPGHSKFDLQ